MNKLSVVVTGRNDNYDGDFEERLVLALSHNIQSLPNAEFIFVEWNPYLDKPLTCEHLRDIFGNRIRYLVVDPQYHTRYCTIDGFLEYPAKNVGVRRATGEYVLCTNSDVIFSPEVVGKMSGDLQKNKVYRALRTDIKREFKKVSFPVPDRYKLEVHAGVLNASGDFLLLHRDIWTQCTGYCEEFPGQRIHKDSFLVHILTKVLNLPWENLGLITHWRHNSSWAQMYATRPGIGDPKWDFTKCGYEKNKDTWGLTYTREENRNGITWLV